MTFNGAAIPVSLPSVDALFSLTDFLYVSDGGSLASLFTRATSTVVRTLNIHVSLLASAPSGGAHYSPFAGHVSASMFLGVSSVLRLDSMLGPRFRGLEPATLWDTPMSACVGPGLSTTFLTDILLPTPTKPSVTARVVGSLPLFGYMVHGWGSVHAVLLRGFAFYFAVSWAVLRSGAALCLAWLQVAR